MLKKKLKKFVPVVRRRKMPFSGAFETYDSEWAILSVIQVSRLHPVFQWDSCATAAVLTGSDGVRPG